VCTRGADRALLAGYSDPAWPTITAPGLIAAIPEQLNLRAFDPRSNASFDATTMRESLMQPNYALERARCCSFGEATSVSAFWMKCLGSHGLERCAVW
jgi:hypothetical protein